jgi:transposase
MPWKKMEVREQRVEFVVRALRGSEPMSRLCEEFGISRPTGYKWLVRYRASGVEAIAERSRRPLHSPARTSVALESRIVDLRRLYPDWGARKLSVLLNRQGIEIPSSTIHRVLLRHGLVRDKDRHRPALQRFEREHPNELWQMDFKGPQGFNKGSPVGPLSVLDDHSRYLVSLQHLGSTRAIGVRETLQRAFETAGLPERFWWITARHGGTRPARGASPNSRSGSCNRACGCCLAASGIRRPRARSSVCTGPYSGRLDVAKLILTTSSGWTRSATSTTT